jgi:hypothetical protein
MRYPSVETLTYDSALKIARDAKARLLRLARFVERNGRFDGNIDWHADLLSARHAMERAYADLQELTPA